MVTYRYQLTLAAKSRFHEVFYIYNTPTLTDIYRNQSAKFATMILSIKQKGFQRFWPARSPANRTLMTKQQCRPTKQTV